MTRYGLFAGAAMAVACLLGAMGAAAAQDNGATAKPAAAAADPVPDLLKSAPDVARGRSIFVGTCGAYCHKANAKNGDAPNLFDCDWIHGGSDAEVFHTITHGAAGTRMVAFGGAIPDADIWRIVAYLQSASQCKK